MNQVWFYIDCAVAGGLSTWIVGKLIKKSEEQEDQAIQDILESVPVFDPTDDDIENAIADIRARQEEERIFYPSQVDVGTDDGSFEASMREREAPTDEDDIPEVEEVEDEADDLEEYITETHPYSSVFSGEPYVIDESKFFDETDGYSQEHFDWRADEQMMYDMSGNIVTNVPKYCGYDCIDKFGLGSTDKRIVYVQNDRLMMKFEIVLN